MKIRISILLISVVLYSCGQYSNRKKDILESFHEVEISMDKSARNLSLMSDDLVNEIKLNSDTQGDVYQSALIVDRTTKGFVYFVDSLHGLITKISQKNGIDDISNHNRLFIEGGKGAELKNRINNTRETLLSVLTETERVKVKSDLVAKDPIEHLTWETELFQHTPAAAVVTLLKKIENDAYHTNIQVLQLLLKRENDK